MWNILVSSIKWDNLLELHKQAEFAQAFRPTKIRTKDRLELFVHTKQYDPSHPCTVTLRHCLCLVLPKAVKLKVYIVFKA